MVDNVGSMAGTGLLADFMGMRNLTDRRQPTENGRSQPSIATISFRSTLLTQRHRSSGMLDNSMAWGEFRFFGSGRPPDRLIPPLTLAKSCNRVTRRRSSPVAPTRLRVWRHACIPKSVSTDAVRARAAAPPHQDPRHLRMRRSPDSRSARDGRDRPSDCTASSHTL